MGKRLGVVGLALISAACSSAQERESSGSVDTYGTSASGSSGNVATASASTGVGSSSTPSASATSGPPPGPETSSGSSTGDAPKFDLGIQPDMPPVQEKCPDDALMANDNGQCAIDPVSYDRDAGLLTLTIVKGQLYELTDPSVEVIFSTDQLGYEGFFTIAREEGTPDVFYMVVADDDFMHLEPDGECGITIGACETDCMPAEGGDVCRAFVDDFIPIVAGAYVGSPYTLDTFGRRTSPNGECCADDFSCNASVSSYTEHVVTGPGGTMHFIFQDGFAFLDTMGWSYDPRENVNGEAQFEFDLCSLPVPEG
ncbi:MAG: hypothetical protein KUG77_29545 [Nannocystaceae bacterium]|nr:hypothetical protein [Nannocystaceae bacterium]